MSGKQFSFFLGSSDQNMFEDALNSSGDIAFLKLWPISRIPEELITSRIFSVGQEVLKILISRREDISKIRFLPIRGRGEFSCDTTFEPIVEFSRCYVGDRYIRAGRLYRVDKYWDENEQLISKSVEFVEWADRLYKLAKASLTKVDQGYYAGAEAIELRNAGLAFEGLDIAMGAIKD